MKNAQQSTQKQMLLWFDNKHLNGYSDIHGFGKKKKKPQTASLFCGNAFRTVQEH